jgi:hypothetical protein
MIAINQLTDVMPILPIGLRESLVKTAQNKESLGVMPF